jgi:integrase
MTAGHIRRRGARSWEIKFDIGADPATGKRRIRYHSFKGTKREAQLKLAQLVADNEAGNYVDVSKLTVSEFFDRWERDWAATNVGPKTLERYREIVRNQIKPHIGNHPIQKLRPVNLTALYATLMRGDNGLAARTVGHVHRVLHRALGHAATWGVVVQNVASLVSPPRVASTEIEMLREDDIKAVLQKLALRWQDVDLDAGKIRVERSLEQTKAGLRFKSPKTKHGRRTITIDPATVAELRAHRKGQAERRLTLGLGKPLADALVFPTWDFQVRSPNALTKEWSVAMAEAGLKVTLHSLRHTHASSLIAAGVDVLTISRRLGHASPTITLGVYGHLFANTDDRAAQVMADLFSKVSTD